MRFWIFCTFQSKESRSKLWYYRFFDNIFCKIRSGYFWKFCFAKSAWQIPEIVVYYMSRIEVWLSLVEHYVRDVGAASSNLVTSTIEKTRSFGKFSRCCVFCFIWGKPQICTLFVRRHFKRTRKSRTEYNKKPPPKLQYFGAAFILCLFVVFPCHVMQETMRHTKKPPQDNLTSHNGFFMYTWTF